jgi:hypothetical protein
MTGELIEEITLASIVQGWGAARDGKVAMASFADRSIGFEETCDRRTAATLEFLKKTRLLRYNSYQHQNIYVEDRASGQITLVRMDLSYSVDDEMR